MGCLALLLVACKPREFLIDDETMMLFIIAVQKAADSRKVDAIMGHYAPDAEISIQLDNVSHPLSGTMSREEYKTRLSAILQDATDYKVEWNSPDVKIAPDGRSARMILLRTETIATSRGKLQITALETDELGLLGNKIVFLRQSLTTPPTDSSLLRSQS